jgi:hypothetical protein
LAKSILISFLLCVLCYRSAYCQVDNDSSYFPLAIGNQWIYKTISSAYVDTETVVDTQRVNGRLYYGFAINSYPPSLWFRKDSDKVYLAETMTIPPDTTDIKEYLIYGFSADVNESWDLTLTGLLNCEYGGKITVESRNDVITTPVGTFTNCICFSHRVPCRDVGRSGEWFATGIGRVAYNEVTFFGGRNFVIAQTSIVTDIADHNYSHSVNTYNLLQNYPNPFNPTTNITFQLLERSHVVVDIYDALGRKIETLVNTYLNRGYHSVVWYTSKQPSGIYFCRTRTNEFAKTIKLVLVR